MGAFVALIIHLNSFAKRNCENIKKVMIFYVYE